MESNRCNFEQSKALKVLGYSWETKGGYAENEDGTHEEWHDREWELNRLDVYPYMADYKAPTISDAIRWFRIEKGLHGWVSKDKKGYRDMFHGVNDGWSWGGQYWDNHDDAEGALLNRLIEISNQEKA